MDQLDDFLVFEMSIGMKDFLLDEIRDLKMNNIEMREYGFNIFGLTIFANKNEVLLYNIVVAETPDVTIPLDIFTLALENFGHKKSKRMGIMRNINLGSVGRIWLAILSAILCIKLHFLKYAFAPAIDPKLPNRRRNILAYLYETNLILILESLIVGVLLFFLLIMATKSLNSRRRFQEIIISLSLFAILVAISLIYLSNNYYQRYD